MAFDVLNGPEGELYVIRLRNDQEPKPILSIMLAYDIEVPPTPSFARRRWRCSQGAGLDGSEPMGSCVRQSSLVGGLFEALRLGLSFAPGGTMFVPLALDGGKGNWGLGADGGTVQGSSQVRPQPPLFDGREGLAAAGCPCVCFGGCARENHEGQVQRKQPRAFLVCVFGMRCCQAHGLGLSTSTIASALFLLSASSSVYPRVPVAELVYPRGQCVAFFTFALLSRARFPS